MLRTLQSGRGVAALMVAAYHLTYAMALPRYLGFPVFEPVTWRMDVGVEYFFVLSGFIIAFAHRRDIDRPAALAGFFRKRFLRIYPVYWVYLCMFCGLVALGAGTTARLPDGPAGWISAFGLVRLGTPSPPIPVAWTLFHEIGFYAVFATLIANRRLGIVMLAAWVLVIAATFHYASEDQRTPFSTYFSPYNLNFIVGVAAFHLYSRAGAMAGRTALAGGVAIFAAALAAEAAGLVTPVHSLLYALGFGGILSGLAVWERGGGRHDVPVLALLGDASYSIYLTSEAFQSLFLKATAAAGFGRLLPPSLWYALVLALTVGAGILAWLAVERPLGRAFARLSRPGAPASAGTAPTR